MRLMLNNDARRRSRRKKRPIKFNGLVYVELKLKACVFFSESLKMFVKRPNMVYFMNDRFFYA